MRLLSLGLERYGRFTDRVLEFDPAAPVIVVQGANEAGKTTALAAVADVLFGIEERSRFNFLHEYKMMRLSATVATPDGQRLSFARLKRRDKTLVDPASDAVLGGDCLAPFLGAYDRKAFLEVFGLDQARLREGGRKLLAGGGDLAETLLAAAPGLSQVAALRDRLRDGAAQIFNPERRVASHAFYRAVEKRSQAVRRVREQELRVDEVKKVREAADQAATAREGAVGAEIETALALARAEALSRGARELRIIDGHLAARAALGDLAVVPSGFVLRTRALLTQFEEARGALARASDEERAATESLGAITLDDAVLALAELITACDEERAAVQRELASLPNRRDEVAEARAGLKAIATGLGLVDVEALLARKPATPMLARADKLVDRSRAQLLLGEALDKDKAKLAGLRRTAEEARAQLGHIADPAPAKRRLAALDGAEERERALQSLGQRLEATRVELDDRLARLGTGVSDIEALARSPFPALAAAEASLRVLKDATQALVRQREAAALIGEQLAQALARLETLNAGRPAPTEAAIATARRERDALWHRLRPLAQGMRPHAADDVATAGALDNALAGADDLADDRQTETARVADIAQVALQIADLKVRREAAEARVTEGARQCDSLHAAWREAWAPAGLAPLPDEGALALLREIDAIRLAHVASRREAAAGELTREAVRSDRAEAARLRSDLGLAPRVADAATGEAPLAMADLREAFGDLENRFLKGRDHERDLRRIEEDGAEIARRETELAKDRQVLAAEIAEIFPPLAIRNDASVEEARAALDLWRQALTFVADLATAEHRVAGIERDGETFGTHVADLAARAGGALAGEDAFATTRRLRAQLDIARQARIKADAATEALEARRKTAVAARMAFERAQLALSEQLAVAGVTTVERLAPALDRLQAAEACDERLAEARLRLADIRGLRSEDDLRSAIAGEDDESLQRHVAAATAAQETARIARDRAIERDTEARAALDIIEKREGAAGAAQEEQDAVAEIAEAVERFTRDYVAARLLTVAIERYRQQNQSPIVERASRAFAALTGERWGGIAVDYDEDPPRLGALRDGRLLGIEALSEGTADQLFLALRIAAIEEHARRATPLPFLADDLFVTFDEARTDAGFRLLSELGALTQVIVFTHHAHVAESARRVLGPSVATIAL